jgi:hypothetical protein
MHGTTIEYSTTNDVIQVMAWYLATSGDQNDAIKVKKPTSQKH